MGANPVWVVTERSRDALIWWPVFLVTEIVVFYLVLSLDPAGLDMCDPTIPPGPRDVQAAIAGGAAVVMFALAVWRLRRWHLVAALVAVALSSLVWLALLGAEPNC